VPPEDGYIYETAHFIFDASLRSYLPERITPEIFNRYLRRMDEAYDAMLDLIGRAPCDGQKITILHGGDWHDGLQGMLPSPNGPEILWNPDWIWYILQSIAGNEANEWWFEGTLYEIARIFQDDAGDKWNFVTEGLASYIAWLTAAKVGGTFLEGGSLISGLEKLQLMWDINLANFQNLSLPRSFFASDDVLYLIHPLILELGLDEGWALLKKVFRSYYDDSYPPTFAVTREQRAADFFNRISFFLGSDVQQLWMAAARQRWQEQVLDVIAGTAQPVSVPAPKPKNSIPVLAGVPKPAVVPKPAGGTGPQTFSVSSLAGL